MDEYPLSVRPAVSRRVPSCPVVVLLLLCPSVRPVVRPVVVVVRPLSVRSRPSVVVVVRPLSVHPVVRPNITCKTSRSIRRMGILPVILPWTHFCRSKNSIARFELHPQNLPRTTLNTKHMCSSLFLSKGAQKENNTHPEDAVRSPKVSK